ncbi:hypothetical protein Ancab_005179 [Ancistrocladus abbreviatus]
MELPQIAEFARNFAVMVRVKGPDPKGLKMRKHAFHHFCSGKTTLSVSGMLLPDNLRDVCKLWDGDNCLNLVPGCAVVVTVASIVEPFLTMKSKEINFEAQSELIPDAAIDVMVEGKLGPKCSSEEMDEGAPQWFHAEILRLVEVPASAFAIKSLIEASSGSFEHSWEVGWSLASHIDIPHRSTNTVHKEGKDASSTEGNRHLTLAESGSPNLMAKATTRIAFLQLPALLNKDLPKIMISPCNKRGDALLAMGSPFGILSPMHFFNSISLGSISNCCPPASSDISLLMADIRCLPGTEGCPVFGELAHLIGLLTRPLRQTGGAEIQLVIPWQAIEAACFDIHQQFNQMEKGIQFVKQNSNDLSRTKINSPHCTGSSDDIQKQPLSSPPSLVRQAMTSVCLVTMKNGVWASGILLNNEGLILTNAHLLEPWRFGRTTPDSGSDGTRLENLSLPFEDSAVVKHGIRKKKIGVVQPILQNADSSLDFLQKGQENPIYRGHSRIRVRLDHVEPWVWCSAKVFYVSQGPLDISLLQLESVPDDLNPIIPDLSCPSPGSKAFVIGHGLFGPRCGLLPSICSGVISKVVKAKMSLPCSSSSLKDTLGEFPVMA